LTREPVPEIFAPQRGRHKSDRMLMHANQARGDRNSWEVRAKSLL